MSQVMQLQHLSLGMCQSPWDCAGASCPQPSSSAPYGLIAPARSVGPGSPTSMGCAHRIEFLANSWLCGDPSRANKLAGLAAMILLTV